MTNHTIINHLFEHAHTRPQDISFRYLSDLDRLPEELTYLELWNGAAAIASYLRGVARPGARIMLFFPPGLAYVKAFYGCLMAGMVAVPLYPPHRNGKSSRIFKVAGSCESTIALTTRSELAVVQSSWQQQNSSGLALDIYPVDDIPPSTDKWLDCPPLGSDSIAFLQYTSGSTGSPKGVIITHNNIIANMEHLVTMSTGNRDDVFVNWLPLFHDMGLVITLLWPVYLGATSVLMAPSTFVREPLIWLKAISRYRGTICGAPNFAYDLCVKKVPQSELQSVDLSSWRIAFSSAEPVKALTLRRFSEYFSACHFKDESFYPCYGMAEATVFISGVECSARPTLLTVDKKELANRGISLVDQADSKATMIVGCGNVLPPHNLKIVDPNTGCEVQEGSIGEIWFSGPSVSPGYWKLNDATRETFGQAIVGNSEKEYGYLRTGDLGAMWQGSLFITGRIKDLIILLGENHYPQDLEASAAEAHVAIRPGHVAAFTVAEPDSEQLVIVAELSRGATRSVNAEEVIGAVRQKIYLDHELNVNEVVLLEPYEMPMTTSGKIQRKRVKQLLLADELRVVGRYTTTSSSPGDHVSPRSELERVLHDIWSSKLKLKRISVEASFIDVGGDSITAIEISSEVCNRFPKIGLNTDQLLECLTIAEMAEWIELRKSHANRAELASAATNAEAIRV